MPIAFADFRQRTTSLSALFADFLDDVGGHWTGVAACRGEFWSGLLRFLYFALASVFVSHGG